MIAPRSAAPAVINWFAVSEASARTIGLRVADVSAVRIAGPAAREGAEDRAADVHEDALKVVE
jgi:hypothetical protein